VTRTSASARPLHTAGLAAAALAIAAPVLAASTYTITPSTPDLGSVTSAASGDTVFRIDPISGGTTVVSGTGVRAGSGSVRALITVACTGSGQGNCSKNLNVRLAPIGSSIGRGRSLTRILASMGTAVLTCTPQLSGQALLFCIGPIGLNSSKTFWIGADFGIAGDDSGLPTGLAESDFSVWTAEQPAAASSGPNGGFRAQVFRSLAIAKTSDLVFGSVVKPAAGSGTVAIDAATGARAVTGGVVGVANPTPTRAVFNVTGEGGQAISVSVPASFQMTGPQPITVTTTNSAAGAPVLSGALGSPGSYSFGVGGSAPITSTTPDGSYSGSFTVTVAYN
jgi:hypothetical protein